MGRMAFRNGVLIRTISASHRLCPAHATKSALRSTQVRSLRRALVSARGSRASHIAHFWKPEQPPPTPALPGHRSSQAPSSTFRGHGDPPSRTRDVFCCRKCLILSQRNDRPNPVARHSVTRKHARFGQVGKFCPADALRDTFNRHGRILAVSRLDVIMLSPPPLISRCLH